MASGIRQQLLDKVASTSDERLLHTLNDDFEYLKRAGKSDSFPELSDADNAELMTMLDEPFGTDPESYQEFKDAVEKWRTR